MDSVSPLTDEQLMEILNDHLPSQGESFEWIPFARAVLAAAGNSGSPHEQALHAALRKHVIKTWFCAECDGRPVDGKEQHAPGCLAAPAAQQPLGATNWGRLPTMADYDPVVAAQQPVADARQPHLLSCDPDVMRGAIVIAGTRIPISTPYNYYKAGFTHEKIMSEYPDLSREQIDTAILACRHQVDRHDSDGALPKLSNATKNDVDAFVASLKFHKTPWANGCAALLKKIWSDRERLRIGVADGRADALLILRELVACKELKEALEASMGKDGEFMSERSVTLRDEYRRRQPQAWEAARAYLAQLPAQQRDPDWQPETKHDL